MNSSRQLRIGWTAFKVLRLHWSISVAGDQLQQRLFDVRAADSIDLATVVESVGSGLDVIDNSKFCFWTPKRIACEDRLRTVVGANSVNGGVLIFSDYFDESWWYGIDRVSSSVLMLGTSTGRPEHVADTLDEFIDYYVSDSSRIYASYY